MATSVVASAAKSASISRRATAPATRRTQASVQVRSIAPPKALRTDMVAAPSAPVSLSIVTAMALLISPHAVASELPHSHFDGAMATAAEAGTQSAQKGLLQKYETLVAVNPEAANTLDELAAVNQQLKAKAGGQMDAVAEAVVQYTDEISDQIKDAAGDATSSAKGAADKTKGALQGAAGQVKAAVGKVGQDVTSASKSQINVKADAGKVQEVAGLASSNVQEGVDKVGAGLKDAAGTAKANVKEAAGAVQGTAEQAQANVKEAAGKGKGWFSGFGGKAKSQVEAVADSATGNAKQLAGKGQGAVEDVIGGAKGAAGKAQGTVANLADSAKSVSAKLKEAGSGGAGQENMAGVQTPVGGEPSQQAIDGIKNQLGNVKSMLGKP